MGLSFSLFSFLEDSLTLKELGADTDMLVDKLQANSVSRESWTCSRKRAKEKTLWAWKVATGLFLIRALSGLWVESVLSKEVSLGANRVYNSRWARDFSDPVFPALSLIPEGKEVCIVLEYLVY